MQTHPFFSSWERECESLRCSVLSPVSQGWRKQRNCGQMPKTIPGNAHMCYNCFLCCSRKRGKCWDETCNSQGRPEVTIVFPSCKDTSSLSIHGSNKAITATCWFHLLLNHQMISQVQVAKPPPQY